MPISGGPHYTQFPDELLDFWLAHLSHAEWRVLCYIVRHTFGWKKAADTISYRQFLHGVTRRDGSQADCGCGLKSATALASALATLEERQLIRRVATRGEHGVVAVSAYEVWVAEEGDGLPAVAGAVAEKQNGAQRVRRLTPKNGVSQTPKNGVSAGVVRLQKMESGLLQKMETQETTTLQQTTNQETTSSASPRTGSRARRANRAHDLEKQSKEEPPMPPSSTRKSRERACKSPEEEEQREELMQAFNDLLRPVAFGELGRCRSEMLRGLREHELAGMLGCMRAMSSSKRFVGQAWITPVAVTRNVLLWEDAGRPRQWSRVEEYAATKARQQGGR